MHTTLVDCLLHEHPLIMSKWNYVFLTDASSRQNNILTIRQYFNRVLFLQLCLRILKVHHILHQVVFSLLEVILAVTVYM